MKADRPLSAPMRRETEETWKQVNDLFRKHGLAEPPVRLRDELVTALEWAWYGQALDQTSEPQTTDLQNDPATLRSYCQQLLDLIENYGVEVEGEDNDLVAHISRSVDPAHIEAEGRNDG